MLPPFWLLVVLWFRKLPLLNVSVPWLVSVPLARFWKSPAARLMLPLWLLVVPWLTY